MAAWRSGMGGLVCLLVACGSGTGAGSISGGRGTSPEAGSEDAGGVADAGNPNGGGGSPGTDAGPGGSGGNDAGPTGPGDGGTGDAGPIGSNDGGTGGPTACATPGRVDVCRHLNPPLPPPVVHQEKEILSDMGKGLFCGEGAYPASGTGVVLHPMTPEGLPPRLDFVDRAGAQIGSFNEFSIATFRSEVIPQRPGFGIFAPYIGGLGRYPVALVDDHGVRRGGTGGLAVAELTAGGVGVFSVREEAPGCNHDTRLFVQRFDESGAPALRNPTELGCYS